MGGMLREVFRRMNNTENLFGTPGFVIMVFVMAGKGKMGGTPREVFKRMNNIQGTIIPHRYL
jgi:hypothetical protein